jgi:flagellin
MHQHEKIYKERKALHRKGFIMGFRINTNVGAMNAHRNATMNNIGLDKSLNSLSSGLRINRAADDSAGLAIADKLSAQSQGLGQAIRNSNDGVGLIQTADGALEEYTNILKRVRVLATQAANDTQDTTSRSHIQKEVTALLEEAQDIATTTKFNGRTLLDGKSGEANDGISCWCICDRNSDCRYSY